MKSHFFAYINKIRWVIRWGLKRNTVSENVMEHSWEVATIAHCLALLRNRYFHGSVDANAVATTALYHDCSEVITGDMPSPVKYHSKAIEEAYKAIEHKAKQELVDLLPTEIREDFADLMITDRIPREHRQLVKAADTIAAYLKCQSELAAGNTEFIKAAEDIQARLKSYAMPEVDLFLTAFAPSYALTLDELINFGDSPTGMDDEVGIV